jgi:hypothetical protein
LHNKEVIIWDSLIKWGINQTPKLKDEWIGKNYEDLKNTLSIFIPFIKFNYITSEDFYDKVRPYETIIPNNIYDEIMRYYLVKQPELHIYNSKIINSRFVNVIVSLIDKKESRYPSIFNRTEDRFKLAYRGSRDGFDNNSLGDRCKNRIVSLILIKIRESDEIFVGYSSAGFGISGNILWFDDHHHSSDYLFLSFKNNGETQRTCFKVEAVKQNILYDFGQNTLYSFECCSLRVVNQMLNFGNASCTFCTCVGCARAYKSYNIEEIEVFNVAKPFRDVLKNMLFKTDIV